MWDPRLILSPLWASVFPAVKHNNLYLRAWYLGDSKEIMYIKHLTQNGPSASEKKIRRDTERERENLKSLKNSEYLHN